MNSVPRLIDRPMHGGNLAWAAALAECPPDAILDFSASINPLGPPASAIAAIQRHLSHLRDYPDPEYRLLRVALGRFHQVPPEWVLPGNGAAELLTWAGRDLAQQQTTWLLTPAFGDYRRALSAFDACVKTVAIDPLVINAVDTQAGNEQARSGEDFGWKTPDWTTEAFDRTLAQNPGSTVGLLLNNPHNPTGMLYDRERLLKYLEQAALVVVDEAFMDFLPSHAQQSLIDRIQDYPNLVILRSLTKFYSMPGLRLGYAIAHPDRLKRWQQWRDPWSVNSLAAAVGEAVVQDAEFQQQTWNWLATARPQFLVGLQQQPGLFPYPGTANFLLVRSRRSVVDLQTELLKRHRILIRDCLSFPELGDRFFRVAIRTDAENQQLLAGLAEVLSNPE